MGYSISEVITHATAGDAILVTKAAGNFLFNLEIGGRSIPMADAIVTRVSPTEVNAGVTTNSSAATNSLDLGTLFTANQVLESASLRGAITSGQLIASAGTVALSKQVTSA